MPKRPGGGLPEFTEIRLRDGYEYMVHDTRYGLRMHSFTGPAQVSQERFEQATHRRLQFLTRKLLEDLQDGGKIFVRTPGGISEPPERLLHLHRAIRRHGPGTLLFIDAATRDANRAGQVEWLAEGVMLGWIGQFNVTQVSHEDWRAVCRAAYAAWVAAKQQPN